MSEGWIPLDTGLLILAACVLGPALGVLAGRGIWFLYLQTERLLKGHRGE